MMIAFHAQERPLKSRLVITLLFCGLLHFPIVSSSSPSCPQEVTDYASHFNRGNNLMQRLYFHDAVAEFREAVRLNPSYLPAHQALAVGYTLTRRFDLAWEEVAFVRKTGAKMADGFMRALGQEITEKDAASKRKTNDQKLVDAQRATAAEPKNSALHARLGLALSNSGDFLAAQREANLALQLNPMEPVAHLVMGTMLGGDPPNSQEALRHLRFYLQEIPRTPSAFPDIVQACLVLGDLYRRADKEAEALIAFEAGLKLDPENPELLNNAAWLYATASETAVRNPKRALAYAQKAAVNSKEGRASVLDTLGESFYANERFDEAIIAEKKAMALSPQNGLFKDQLKKFQRAKQDAILPGP
jgi:Flp pilus assembly protein TadD